MIESMRRRSLLRAHGNGSRMSFNPPQPARGFHAHRDSWYSVQQTRETPAILADHGGFQHKVGDDVLSHRAAPAVPSAL